ncbi:MAG TPA: hypothetical protein VI814_08385 [Candidatus Limnocylindria bacterium]
MTYEERLEAAARVAAVMRAGEVDAMCHVPGGDREAFHRAALRIATRCGVTVRIETAGETASAVFFRDDRRP